MSLQRALENSLKVAAVYDKVLEAEGALRDAKRLLRGLWYELPELCVDVVDTHGSVRKTMLSMTRECLIEDAFNALLGIPAKPTRNQGRNNMSGD